MATMTVTLVQTSDAIFYYPMLVETARTVRAFCARNGFAYEQYVGIKRGHMPWQATYNRVYILKEMLDRGMQGWVLYLDADAFIQDLDFDLGRYLAERSKVGAIFAGYSTCDTAYDINAGGFAINLSHPVGKSIILDWYRSVADVPSEIFEGAVHWEHDLANDQHLLWQILKRYVEELDLSGDIIFERANRSYVNNGPFIVQLLRSFYDSYAERLVALKKRVNEVLAKEEGLAEEEGAGIYMSTQHPKLVTASGRKTLQGIVSNAQHGGLMFGPYIHVPAGRYKARIFGEVRMAEGQTQLTVLSDVATDRGFKVPVSRYLVFDGPRRGIVSELRFELPEDVHDLEVRLTVGPEADVVLHAIQILPLLGDEALDPAPEPALGEVSPA
jgi:hypothetical protein